MPFVRECVVSCHLPRLNAETGGHRHLGNPCSEPSSAPAWPGSCTDAQGPATLRRIGVRDAPRSARLTDSRSVSTIALEWCPPTRERVIVPRHRAIDGSSRMSLYIFD